MKLAHKLIAAGVGLIAGGLAAAATFGGGSAQAIDTASCVGCNAGCCDPGCWVTGCACCGSCDCNGCCDACEMGDRAAAKAEACSDLGCSME